MAEWEKKGRSNKINHDSRGLGWVNPKDGDSESGKGLMGVARRNSGYLLKAV